MEAFPNADIYWKTFFDKCRENGRDPVETFMKTARSLCIPREELGLPMADREPHNVSSDPQNSRRAHYGQ